MLAAGAALVAVQSSLLLGYAQWGGIKEVAGAALVVISVACLIPVLESGARLRSFLPLAAAAFAVLGVNGYGGGIWLPVSIPWRVARIASEPTKTSVNVPRTSARYFCHCFMCPP